MSAALRLLPRAPVPSFEDEPEPSPPETPTHDESHAIRDLSLGLALVAVLHAFGQPLWHAVGVRLLAVTQLSYAVPAALVALFAGRAWVCGGIALGALGSCVLA